MNGQQQGEFPSLLRQEPYPKTSLLLQKRTISKIILVQVMIMKMLDGWLHRKALLQKVQIGERKTELKELLKDPRCHIQIRSLVNKLLGWKMLTWGMLLL
jgi:hypothetical protein